MKNGECLYSAFNILESRGVSRREFMKFCASVASYAGLSSAYVPRVADALSESVALSCKGEMVPVIWLEGASCSGCTESIAKSVSPDVATIILEMISLNYCDILQAGAGDSVEQAMKETVSAGNFILVHEGAILRKFGGSSLRVAGRTGAELLIECAKAAQIVIAVGSCSVNGGWCAASPNLCDASGVEKFLRNQGISTKVINIPGCPVNPEYVTSILVNVIFMKDPKLIELTRNGYPACYFSQTIHDNCERRGHFEAGEFVYEYGSIEERRGYCLYPLGCKGPTTKNRCGVVRWNNAQSWCVHSGCPCIGCCEADPFDRGHNWVDINTPFAKRFRSIKIGDCAIEPETVGIATVGMITSALIVHGFGMKLTGRTKGGAEFEKIREWDKRHPDRSIGVYDDVSDGGAYQDDELVKKNSESAN